MESSCVSQQAASEGGKHYIRAHRSQTRPLAIILTGETFFPQKCFYIHAHRLIKWFLHRCLTLLKKLFQITVIPINICTLKSHFKGYSMFFDSFWSH